MTENEAIEALRLINTSRVHPFYSWEEMAEVRDIAISALKEIQQYREIGTVEEYREAVGKQKPKMPDYEGDGYADGEMVYDTWICPNCGKKYEVDYDDYKYCPNCGQASQDRVEMGIIYKL